MKITGEDGMRNRGRKEGRKTHREFLPHKYRQKKVTLNYLRELRHVIKDNLRLFGH